MADWRALLANHYKIVKIIWVIIQVMSFCFIISAMAVVGDSFSKVLCLYVWLSVHAACLTHTVYHGAVHCRQAYNFAAVWEALLVIAFSVGGTVVLFRVRVCGCVCCGAVCFPTSPLTMLVVLHLAHCVVGDSSAPPCPLASSLASRL